MSTVYSQEYLQQLAAAQRAQQTSAAFLEINDVAINYNTEYEAIEAMSQEISPYGEAWYYDPVRNAAGDVIGMDYVQVPTSVENPPAVINSNVTNPVFTKNNGRIRINGSGGGTPPNKFSKGAKLLSTELPAGSTVAGRLGWLAAATALGTKLGKTLSSAIYQLGGGWEYNPENWRNLVDENSPLDDLDKAALRILFGLDEETGSVTPYLNSDGLGAMFLTMLQSGVYNQGTYEADYTGEEFPGLDAFTLPLTMVSGMTHFVLPGTSGVYREYYANEPCDYVVLMQNETGSDMVMHFLSETPFSISQVIASGGSAQILYSGSVTTASGKTIYYCNPSLVGYYFHNSWDYYGLPSNTYDGSSVPYPYVTATIVYDGNVSGGQGKEGVEDDTAGATYIPTPNTITGTDLDTVNQQLPLVGMVIRPRSHVTPIFNPLMHIGL